MGIGTRGGSLAPGGVVGDGRYRLLAQFGVDERTGAHLWRARDGQQRRDVALTLLVGNPAHETELHRGTRTLERASHIGTLNHPALARVLDILSLGDGISAPEGLLGVVVAQWTQGSDLIDLVADQPADPVSAARMVQTLAESVDQAHQSGIILGIDHPQRLRLTPTGQLCLAFPGPSAEATLRDDVTALGAVLYLLLTGYWPLPGGPAALPVAPRSSHGRIAPPRSLVPAIPEELSTLALRTVEDSGHGAIRTSAAFLRALDRIASAAEEQQRTPEQAEQPQVEPDGTVWTTKKPGRTAAQRRKLALGVTVLVVAAVAILAWLGMLAISFFQEDTETAGPPINLASPEQSPPPPTDSESADPHLGQPVAPTDIEVYNPEGEGDNVEEAAHSVDGDPDTTWSTDQYRQQFPGLKSGVGLIADFDDPIDLAEVQVTADSPDTSVEIRTAESKDPELEDTEVVASGDLDDTETSLSLEDPVPTDHVIVWVTNLSGEEPKLASEINELTFLPTED